MGGGGEGGQEVKGYTGKEGGLSGVGPEPGEMEDSLRCGKQRRGRGGTGECPWGR